MSPDSLPCICRWATHRMAGDGSAPICKGGAVLGSCAHHLSSRSGGEERHRPDLSQPTLLNESRGRAQEKFRGTYADFFGSGGSGAVSQSLITLISNDYTNNRRDTSSAIHRSQHSMAPPICASGRGGTSVVEIRGDTSSAIHRSRHAKEGLN